MINSSSVTSSATESDWAPLISEVDLLLRIWNSGSNKSTERTVVILWNGVVRVEWVMKGWLDMVVQVVSWLQRHPAERDKEAEIVKVWVWYLAHGSICPEEGELFSSSQRTHMGLQSSWAFGLSFWPHPPERQSKLLIGGVLTTSLKWTNL